ncbi:MBL fold metallo-hydrolase [Subtercola lobariae]|uniref:MBL fold metallo-hydrolase n=1 Tax=Subtercola lobariae TaxID=1588641 RepID=A0A917B308_9MICO|nr:MBL fold metallo-hydrolase [Subtercola lobariae]GGF18097.1 MBL fold metallo-hydrolase [Subtercola lobariae]
MAQKQYATRSLGEYTVTTVYDGFALAPAATLVTEDTGLNLANQWHVFRQTRKLLMRADVLMFVVDTGDERVLIDAGAGRLLGPTMGSGLKNLAAAGHDPADITKILISHPHPDHIGGISVRGQIAYPNAHVYVEADDHAYWTAPENTYRKLGEVLAPYVSLGRVQLFRAGDEFAKGVRAVALPGHTVGHAGFEVQSLGQSALFWGDIIHDYTYQLAHPDRTLVLRDFDKTRVAEEVAMQQKMLAEVSASHLLVIAPHAPFPGAGYVDANPDGTYAWRQAA